MEDTVLCGTLKLTENGDRTTSASFNFDRVPRRVQSNSEMAENTKTNEFGVYCVYPTPKGSVVLTEHPTLRLFGKGHRGAEGSILSYTSYIINSGRRDLFMEPLKSFYPRETNWKVKRVMGGMEAKSPEDLEAGALIYEKILRNGFLNKVKGEYWILLFNFASLFNHSCDPNADWEIMDDFSIKITLLRDVKVKEEITISYNSDNLIKNDKLRRRSILKHLGFVCRCERCTKK